MTDQNRRCLVLFAREPVAGQVKTRLVPALGEEGALALYRQLLSRQIALVKGYSSASSQLWVDGNTDQQDFNAFSGQVFCQQQGDIGKRMFQALNRGLEVYDTVVLIGCDCPGISTDYLDLAFQVLEQGNDAVFGPAADGGYVLVGLNRASPEIFQAVDWGTSDVMVQTRNRLQAMGMTWQELPVLHDIDEPDDLAWLPADMTGQWQI